MADASTEKPKIFISYSRKDSADFTDELVAGLELAGFAPFLDRLDISVGEEWEARLGDLIDKSDTVVFVVSPEAVKSERCVWEIDKALDRSKRLLPVIYKPVADTDIPEQLRRLQFVRFDTGPGIARPLTQLAEALRQDLEWIREHTRLSELAMRWQARSRSDSLLLRGDELNAAKAWAANRKPAAPEITEAQRYFLNASIADSKIARWRKQRTHALVALLLVGIFIGLVGWINQVYVKEQTNWYTTMRPYMVAQVRPYVLTAQAERALMPQATFRECAEDCPEMIVIPAGEFTMGSPPTETGRYANEGPQHKVTIASPFAVSKVDVVFRDWDACVAVGGCAPVSDVYGRDSMPVINVTWDDAKQYLGWFSKMTGKSYRLLTEAEWEYAARAGTTTAYYWGDEIGMGNASCNGCGSQWDNRGTSPVGSFKPNAFGLYDMAGNVMQWVQDCYPGDYTGAPTDGSAWTSGDCSRHVARGGSWVTNPQGLRLANRLGSFTGFRSSILGFRVGRTLTP